MYLHAGHGPEIWTDRIELLRPDASHALQFVMIQERPIRLTRFWGQRANMAKDASKRRLQVFGCYIVLGGVANRQH